MFGGAPPVARRGGHLVSIARGLRGEGADGPELAAAGKRIIACCVMPLDGTWDVQLCDTGISLLRDARGRAPGALRTQTGPGEVAGALLLLRAYGGSAAVEVDRLAVAGVDRRGDLGEHARRDGGVDGQRDSAWPPWRSRRDLHAGDVDAGVAEDPADGADDAGPVGVA